jgi:hypothetical protein
MRKFQAFALATSLGLSLAIAPTAQAKAKITRPSSPTVANVQSSFAEKGKVDVTVTIALPSSNGGSKITGSKVWIGGKSCTIKKTRTWCYVTNVKVGTKLKITAASKNKKGFSKKSAPVTFKAKSFTNAKFGDSTTATPAAPKVYAIGDIGPGGGKVFMLPASLGGKGGDHYYEVAPATWYGTAKDPQVNWCTLKPGGVITGNTYSQQGIGWGYWNTKTMVTDCQSGAGNLAASYVGGGLDWYLPSQDELSELWLTRNSIGDFSLGGYWSSTEFYDTRSAMYVIFNPDFFDGTATFGNKQATNPVRPIRSFK